MATVHPSRMGLVPLGSASASTNHREDRNGVPRRDSPDRYRGRDDRERARHRSRSRSRSRDRRYNGGRRRSPDYGTYQRETPPHKDGPQAAPPPPWRSEDRNMYLPREGRRDFRGAGAPGDDYFDGRRKQRENSSFSIWPPSPKAPSRDLSPHRDSKRSRKRRRSPSATDSSSDDGGDRRKKDRKSKRNSRKDTDERRGRHKQRHRSHRLEDESDDDRRHRRSRSRRHRSRRSDYSSDEDEDKRRRRSDSKHRRTRSRSAPEPPLSEENEWVEKPAAAGAFLAQATSVHRVDGTSAGVPLTQAAEDIASDDETLGPQPVLKVNTNKKVDEREYGGALLRGEGSAMAAFLREGDTDARIPRRGEIGLTSDEIATFESVGYVMSGSRHRRMNAVRMRKENQVISAEEKRGILKLQREERERREAILRDEFKELVQDKLKGSEMGRNA